MPPRRLCICTVCGAGAPTRSTRSGTSGPSSSTTARAGARCTASASTSRPSPSPGFGPHDLFVVGDEGLILRSDGVGFERVDGKTRDALYALWGLDADHVLAVGDFGAILRWNGREWSSFSAGTEAFLYGVVRPGARRHRRGRPVGHRGALRRPALVAAAPPARTRICSASRRLDDTRWITVGTRGTALVWDGECLDRGGHRHRCRPARGVGGPRRDGLGRRGRGHGAPAPAVRVPRRESGALAAGELHEYHRPSNCGVRVAE